MERLKQMMARSSEYPINMTGSDVQEHTVVALKDQLDLRSKKLFCSRSQAAVDFLEMYSPEHGTFAPEAGFERRSQS